MQTPETELCTGCSRPLLDLEDELVCPGCGQVREKCLVETEKSYDGKLPLFGTQYLGSYMGPKSAGPRERSSRISGNNTSFYRMKVLSDYQVKEGSYADCGRLIERVGEKLFLPRVVVLQAASVAKKVMESPHSGRLTVGEVSAYSLVTACKIEGITSASIREILGACASLGKSVSSSAIFHLALESPFAMVARSPEDYLPRVIAKLSMNKRLSRRLAREGALQQAYLGSLRTLAAEILCACEKTSLAGKRPCALAASAVYSAEVVLAAEESRNRRITQKECAECGDAAEYTVREQCATIFSSVVRALTSGGGRNLAVQNVR